MTEFWIHPSLILILGAGLIPLFKGRVRKAWLVAVPLLTFITVLTLADGSSGLVRFLDWTLVFGRVDALSRIFCFIMALMCSIGTVYGLHVEDNLERIASWLYVAGSLGVILAGDFIALFLFWEMMAFSSVFLVWCRRDNKALAAGFRYLLVHGFGGIVLLAGIVFYAKAQGGDFSFNLLDLTTSGIGGWLILFGFLLNAAVPPLHAWLPDAYSEGTVSGSVFMSCFTTKTAVYALIRGFAGTPILLPLGVIMAVYGVVYAVLVSDARRLLAYHIISQVGYMVAGIGIGTPLAISGACAHAFAHILYKGLLFMGTGSVLYMTGTSKFTELGGLYKKMPRTLLFTVIGGVSISGFPLFSGFISKSMIVAGAFESHFLWAGFLLLAVSSGTFFSTTLKMPYFIWFGKNNCSEKTWEKAGDPPLHMQVAMAITSFLCLFLGCFYPFLYKMLPYAVDYAPYTRYHLSETLQILFFTAVGFFLLLDMLTPKATISIDVDVLYRFGGRYLLRFLRYFFAEDASFLRFFPAEFIYSVKSVSEFPVQVAKKTALLACWLTTGFVPSMADTSLDRYTWLRRSSFPVGLGVFLAVSFLTAMSILYFF
ncbi:MAG: Na(+)/H(+) antiporter subunit D [Deltaproteobacteria bacterium]|nr:Na(+)/H(+) antiporter subunit D [Deltaproteobacteria bacterium]